MWNTSEGTDASTWARRTSTDTADTFTICSIGRNWGQTDGHTVLYWYHQRRRVIHLLPFLLQSIGTIPGSCRFFMRCIITPFQLSVTAAPGSRPTRIRQTVPLINIGGVLSDRPSPGNRYTPGTPEGGTPRDMDAREQGHEPMRAAHPGRRQH